MKQLLTYYKIEKSRLKQVNVVIDTGVGVRYTQRYVQLFFVF